MARLAALLALLLLPAISAAAADITVNAMIEPGRLRVGEPGELTFVVQGTSGTPAPQIAAVGGLSVTYVGPATQLSIVNGTMSSSITHRFRVVGQQPGRFSIGPIAVEVGGKRYESNALTFEVVGDAAQQAQAAAGAGAAPANPGLSLTLSAPKTTVYLRERLPLGIALRVGNVRVSDVHYPVVPGDGFALAPLTEPGQRREQTTQGVVQILDFATTLTPLKSGTLVVGPAKLELAVLERGRGRDAFFDRFFSGDPFAARRARELASTPLTLEVLPLPDAGRSADFSGAVGQFDFGVEVAPRTLAAGDPVTITMKIRGEGGLDGVSAPAIGASELWRVYPVQAASQLSTPDPRAQRVASGPDEKTFEQVVIPQRAGQLVLPELRFSYFDPSAGAYRTIGRGGIALDVQPAAAAAAEPLVGAPAAPQATAAPAPEALGRDIVFIKDTPGDLRPIGTRLLRNPLFWAWQPAPLLLWVTAVLYDRRRRRLSGDPRYARFTRAGREARRAIAAARQALDTGDRAQVYDAVATALHDYLAAKLDLPPGSVSAESVGARLRARGLAPQVAAELDAVLASCESARFAPGAHEDGDLQRTLARAESVVRALEQERRLVAPVAVAVALGLAGILGADLARVAAEPSAAESPNTIFFGANKLYADGRYAEAAAEYEKIVAAGLESGTLYFNLGNAYFKAGDLGHALLHYERARRLIPRDPDLGANQRYAQSLAGADAGVSRWRRVAFPLAERATTDELVLVASLLYTVLMVVLAARRFVPGAARGLATAASVTAAALALVVTSAGYRVTTLELPRHAVVIAREDTAVRFEPAASGTTHYSTKPGTRLRVLAEREDWAQVARDDGARGWIERAALANVVAAR